MNDKKNLWARITAWVDGDPITRSRAGEDGMAAAEEAPDIKPEKRHHEKSMLERLQEWVTNDELKVYRKFYKILSIILACIIIGCMLMTVSYLPSFGNPDNPANNEVSRKYIEDSMQDTGAVNIVAGMILDYRAFDTFGESTVLFIAAGAVIILLRNDRRKREKDMDDTLFEPDADVILQNIARLLIPASLIFGVYVVLNGHLSPGGGFSGGTIMGAALILYCNAFGAGEVQRFFTYRTFNAVTVTALGFYAAAKSYSFYTGANHIHSVIPTGVPGDLISSGLILPLNICVGVIVACTMFGFYSLFNREAI